MPAQYSEYIFSKYKEQNIMLITTAITLEIFSGLQTS